MNKISKKEFSNLCQGILDDQALIIKHNPIGTAEETLLWMLVSVLHSYLSLNDQETPCFSGKPTAETYREAISFVLRDRKEEDFDEHKYFALFEPDR